MDEFSKIRSKLRAGIPISYYPTQNQIIEEDDTEDQEDEKNNGEEIFRQNLILLFEKNAKAIEYFATKYFQLSSIDPLVEALQSIESFESFLVQIILSDVENQEMFSYESLTVVNFMIKNNVDLTTFVDQNFLLYLFTSLDSDFRQLAIISLDIINYLIDYVPDIYPIFASNGFIEKLINSSSDLQDNIEQPDTTKYLEQVSNTLHIILTKEIFQEDDLPKLWDLAQLLIQLDCDSSITIVRSLEAFGLICKNGFCGEFSEDVIHELQTGYFNDTVDVFKSFILFLQYYPLRDEFLKLLFTEDTLEDMILEIENDDKEKTQYIYILLGELLFTSESNDFMELTIEKMNNGQFNTKIGILYYLNKILFNSPTKQLIQQLIDADVMNLVESLLSSQNEEAVSTCLLFVETLLNCYSKLFSKKPSEFPNVDVLFDILNDLLQPDNVDETTRLHIGNILELCEC